MKTSDKPFLHSYSRDLKIGDLVWWPEWIRDENGDYVSTALRGAIIDFKIRAYTFSERPVVVAIVLPYAKRCDAPVGKGCTW